MISEFVKPGHFYSVIPNISKNYKSKKLEFINLDFNDEKHEKIIDELSVYLKDFDKTFGHSNAQERQKDLKYTVLNGAFEWMDARILYYFMQKLKPKKIIEIGAGNSTLLMTNTKDNFGLEAQITSIEPYPNDFLIALEKQKKITLVTKNLQDVDTKTFSELEENDILFIDSSHVLKLDSDVMYYFNKIFPLLKKGVMIHIHDIFFPNDYPLDWFKEGRFWNEQYFLYVFLQYNTKFKIEFCNSYSEYKFHDLLNELQKNTYERLNKKINSVFSGGSIWILTQ